MTQEIRKSSNKIIGPLIGGILGVAIVIFLMLRVFHRHSPSASNDIDKELVAVANELNKTCPMMIDAMTRLDNAVALPGNIFQYNYTLVNYYKADLNADDLKMKLQPTIANTIRTNPQLKFFRDKKAIMSYNYNDKNGEFVLNISITPDQYQEGP
ncbi:MAG: hypothetical protein ACHQET_13575 [Chitinophagales bacterium]